MSDKTFFIDEYFKQWDRDIAKARELLANPRYYLEGILVLSCYIGALAAMRFPALRDGEAYVKVVLGYSGRRDFYEQVDLLFFYQWPRSKLRDNGIYKLKNYTEIVEALKRAYGTEEDVKTKTRYVSPAAVTSEVAAATIVDFDTENFRTKLPLFSLAELLYRYVRCDAVHNADFPFINKGIDAHGNESYVPNHAITHEVLLDTTMGIIGNLRTECLAKSLWPYEL